MTEDFARINAPRVEKILYALDVIEKSARSQKALDRVPGLLAPVAERLAALAPAPAEPEVLRVGVRDATISQTADVVATEPQPWWRGPQRPVEPREPGAAPDAPDEGPRHLSARHAAAREALDREPWARLAREAGFEPINTEGAARAAFRLAAEKLAAAGVAI